MSKANLKSKYLYQNYIFIIFNTLVKPYSICRVHGWLQIDDYTHNNLALFVHTTMNSTKERGEKKEKERLALFVSLLEGILLSKLSTRWSLVNPDPSLGIGRGPFLPISPRAVQAAIANRGDVLSKNEPVSTCRHNTEQHTSYSYDLKQSAMY